VVSSVAFRNTATSDPGLTNPATRAGSVRLTEIAIFPSGICSDDGTAEVCPNLASMICSPG